MSEILTLSAPMEELIFHIENQKCLLILGPEALKINDTSYQQSFLTELVNLQPDGVKFKNEKDGLLIFKGEEERNLVDFVLKKARKSLQSPDFTILDKLIQIPFSAVISVTADDFYYQRLTALGYQPESAFFRSRQHGHTLIDKKPTPDAPLIYNLFGSFEEHESMILDYTDLNKFLKSMMSLSESGLPNIVNDLLKESKAFVFCGFEFNKWYTQLLFRLLTIGKPRKFVIKESSIETPAKIFLEKGFAVNFLDTEDADVVDILLQQFVEKGTARKQKTPLTKAQMNLEKIRDFVEYDDLLHAIDFMEELATAKSDTEFVNSMSIQKARIAEATRDKSLGTLTDDAFKTEKNKIREAVLNFAQELCQTQ